MPVTEKLTDLVPTADLCANRLATKPSAFYEFRTVFQRHLVNHYIRNFTNLAARLVMYASISFWLGLAIWEVSLLGAILFLTQQSYLRADQHFLLHCLVAMAFSNKRYLLEHLRERIQ
jgi:hypothetical protein